MAKLVVIRRYKDGSAAYTIPGSRTGIGIKKSLLKDGVTLPDELEIDFDGFVEPGEAKQRKTDPEYLAKVQERADKAAVRAQKTLDRANKLKAQADKLKAKVAGAPATEVPEEVAQ